MPVPVPDSLYDTAFKFKSAKLWKKLAMTQIFGVQLSNKEIGYCSIMGALGEHFALGLYIGEEGFKTYYRLANMPEDISEKEYFEYSVSQNCLQCSFENKDDIPEAEVISVQTYTKSHDIRLRGANSFPTMICVKPYQVPWFIRDKKDYVLMEEALRAGIEVAEKLKSSKPEKLGFSKNAEEIPLLIPEEDGFTWKTCHIPEIAPKYLFLLNSMQTSQNKSRLLRKVNKLECTLIHMQETIQDSPEEPPYFPAILLAMETKNDRFLKTQPVKQYAGNEADVLEDFALNLIAAKRAPKSISVTDDRTEALLSQFCEACGIKLNRVKNFTKLHYAEEELNSKEFFDTFLNFANLIDFMESLPEENLKQIPPELRTDFL